MSTGFTEAALTLMRTSLPMGDAGAGRSFAMNLSRPPRSATTIAFMLFGELAKIKMILLWPHVRLSYILVVEEPFVTVTYTHALMAEGRHQKAAQVSL